MNNKIRMNLVTGVLLLATMSHRTGKGIFTKSHVNREKRNRRNKIAKLSRRQNRGR